MIDLAYAMGSSPSGGSASTLSALVPLILMFGVFYFLLIRPQQKQRRERDRVLANLKRGDRVITQGGIIGTIVGLSDSVVTLRIADQVRVECLRSSVLGLREPSGEEKEKKESGA